MCGIISILSQDLIQQRLIEGLKRLEYRGYDSSGLALLTPLGLQNQRSVGKVECLKELMMQHPFDGFCGIAHTRWATHGEVSIQNAHPHSNGRIALVHNGIIENFSELRNDLEQKGVLFESQTDTEVILHLLERELQTYDPLTSLHNVIKTLRGTFALTIIIKDVPDTLFVAKRGSPLILGISDQSLVLSSDTLGMDPSIHTLCYLEDGDYGILSKEASQLIYTLYNQGVHIERPLIKRPLSDTLETKGNFDHFMLKEIFEQPNVIENSLQANPSLSIDWREIKKIHLVACGTAYYACLVAKHWFEYYAKISVECTIASEFRYAPPPISEGDIGFVISQSGETIDTLKSIDIFKENNIQTYGIVNVKNSSIARAVDHTLYTLCGPEISVASTKAFTAQITFLALLALEACQQRSTLPSNTLLAYFKEFEHIPTLMNQILNNLDIYKDMGSKLKESESILYLGRGPHVAIALEGALKLKELSYINAQGYPAGELKHGPIAIIDEKTFCVLIMPEDAWFEKTVSNLQQVLSRKSMAICITNQGGYNALGSHAPTNKLYPIIVPKTSSFFSPFMTTLPLQLLAYYVALLKGKDIDHPKNLAKSVTVE